MNENQSWRLLRYEIHDAAYNMAIDEAILDAHLEGLVPPTLRIYGWQPPAVSIGYAQRLSEEVRQRIEKSGFSVVRRPTGGRAVLHAGELTYSFVGSSGDGDGKDDEVLLSTSILSAYKQICSALLHAFEALGVELSIGASETPYRDQSDCFLATTSADLHHAGKKMVGSAQLRRRHAVLQHGSILLDQPQDLMNSLLKGRPDREGSDSVRHANLFEITGEAVAIERLETAIAGGFERAFQRSFKPSQLTEPELALAQQYRMRYQLFEPAQRV